MGPKRTVVQNDHDKLVRIPRTNSLPCRFYTREGLHVESLSMLATLAKKAKQREEESCATTAASSEKDDDNSDTKTCSAVVPSLHLYAVPAGRQFMFAPSYVGEKFILEHMTEDLGHPLEITTLSLEPRLFELHGFFTKQEGAKLIDNALNETREEFGMHRSRTGAVTKDISLYVQCNTIHAPPSTDQDDHYCSCCTSL